MPVVVNIFIDMDEHAKKKKSAKRVIVVLRITFCLTLTGWFVTSIISGNNFIRRSSSLIYFFICTLYLWSLFQI